MTKTRSVLPFLASLAILAAGCGSPPPPPPPPPPTPTPAPPPPPPPPPPAAPALALVGAQLDIKGDIEFDIAKATIRDTKGSQDVLNQVLKIMKDSDVITKLRVEGHTDSDGNAADNQSLSEARAAAVVKWLVDHGVAPGRFAAAGCAARDPLVPNDSAEHKQRNRRTEFDIEQIGGKRPDGYTNPCEPNKARH